MDLFKQMPHLTVGFSLNTLDDVFRQQTEPFSSSVLSRLQALQTLHDNGIQTWLHLAPLFPEISDWKSILDKAQNYTDSFSIENLKLRYAALPRVLLFITQYYPDYKDLYHQIYYQKNLSYWSSLQEEILQFSSQRHLSVKVFFSEENPS